MLRVAIIIVSYNVASLLRECLRSIEDAVQGTQATGAPRFAVETIVVDNASSDESAPLVAIEFPQVRLLTPGVNLGFTGANNLALHTLGFDVSVSPDLKSARGEGRGFYMSGSTEVAEVSAERATPDFVLLLNPDAELTPGALTQLVDYLAEAPAVAICGPQLRYSDGRFQHGAFRFPGLGQVALDVLPVAALPGLHRLYDGGMNGRYPAAQWQGAAPFPVDFVLGAAMLVRGAAINQVGGLDASYWMYCEEMDWCLRMRDSGWGIVAVPRAIVIHHEGQSSRQRRWRSFVQLWRSRYRFYTLHRTHYAPGFLLAVRGIVRFGMALHARQARAAFAAGKMSGTELGAALAAYAAVAAL